METSVHDLISLLLPDWRDVHLTGGSIDSETVTLCFAMPTTTACCPRCGAPSAKVRGRYCRMVRDLCWATIPVRLCVVVRKFACASEQCPRRLFTERLPQLPPYARCTPRLREWQLHLALALGGEAGARLSQALHHHISAPTLRRRIRQMPQPRPDPPRVVGVDDWALRKGQRYGTILVDLENHSPVDLLPDRNAETLIAWLKDHPGIEVLSRDRSYEYARAATEGAPQALQVADRFHLLANLRESLEHLVSRHRTDLCGITIPSVLSRTSAAEGTAVFRCPARRSPEEEALRKKRQQHRSDRCRQVHSLKDAGVSILEISRRLDMSRGTVYRALRLNPSTAGPRTRNVASGLDPYLPYLAQRWAEGCHVGMQFYREIVGKGYKGSRKMVAVWSLRQRTHPAPTTPRRYKTEPDEPGRQDPSATGASNAARLPAPRSVAFLLMRRPDLLTLSEKQALEHIFAASAEIRVAYPLIHQFAAMLRSHAVDQLVGWIQSAAASPLLDLQNYAAGLEKDRTAVEAAVSQRWSNGQTEGQVNRLKMLKRQMYGRANFDLLRLRVLYA